MQIVGTTLINRNYVHEKINTRLILGISCYSSVQYLSSFSLQSEGLETGTGKTIILFFVFYGRGTWSLTLRVENGFRMFENRVREEVTGGWRKFHYEALHNVIKEDERGRLYSMNRKDGDCIQNCGRKPEEKNNMEDLGMKRMIILTLVLKEIDCDLKQIQLSQCGVQWWAVANIK
jgi:hypothetical protein